MVVFQVQINKGGGHIAGIALDDEDMDARASKEALEGMDQQRVLVSNDPSPTRERAQDG